MNRHQKGGKDAAEWLPARNQCWFAARVVEVRRAYGLTIDRREADALQRVLAGCVSTAMEPLVCHTTTAPEPNAGTDGTGDALSRYDDNGNGRITSPSEASGTTAPTN